MNLLDLRGQRHTPFSRSGKSWRGLYNKTLISRSSRDANVNRKGHAGGSHDGVEARGSKGCEGNSRMGDEDRVNTQSHRTWKVPPTAHSYTGNSVDPSLMLVARAAVFLTYPGRPPAVTASPRALAPTPRYADDGSSAHDDRGGRLSMQQQRRREPRLARSKKPADKAVPRQGRTAAKNRPLPCRD